MTDHRNPPPEPGEAAWNQPDAPAPDWRQQPPPAQPGPATGAWAPNPNTYPYQPPPPAAAWQPMQPAAAGQPTNTLAILSLIFAFVFAPAGLVLGYLARQQIQQRHERGDGLAMAGLVIGIIGTVGYLLICIGSAGNS
jgi:Domain of unknown function (DUF4190)